MSGALVSQHRPSECSVWAARDRLQVDQPEQPAQAGNGGGMNRCLTRGVAWALAIRHTRKATRLISGVETGENSGKS